jgi:hypothetical protein
VSAEAAVLRIVGRTLDVDRLVRHTAFDFDTVHRRGDRRGRGVWGTNIVTVVVSERDCDDLRGQIREATRFLIRHRFALRRIGRVTGVEEVVLDFGIEDRPALGSLTTFPPRSSPPQGRSPSRLSCRAIAAGLPADEDGSVVFHPFRVFRPVLR